MDDIEKSLRAELENARSALDASHSRKSADSVVESTMSAEDVADIEASRNSAILDKLEKKKKELVISSLLILHYAFFFLFSPYYFS